MKKIVGSIVLAVSVVIGIYLVCFLGNPVKYEECIVSEEQFENIMAERIETECLLDALIFDEEILFLDNADRTFYYSLIEGNKEAYNPGIKIESTAPDLKLAFLEEKITEEGIRDNYTYVLLAYTEQEYCRYNLKCTTLPLMNIECQEEILEETLPMNITLFDNRQGTANRLTSSEGTIHIRGASARWYDKKGYRFSLTEDSLGNNVRPRKVSLLGMRQDDDWLLYAAYNDQEKIRNVFSSNLWKYTCASDNAQGIDAGMEYKYIELFMNGEYWGLYALGYPIDTKQMEVQDNSDKEALYKVVGFVREDSYEILDEGNIEGYEVKGGKGVAEGEENWDLLLGYRDNLQLHMESDEELYGGIDIDNAIDLYLFFNLIQGQDNVLGDKIKNQYVAIRKEEDGYKALYAPWDMDISWGNGWTPYEMNNVLQYGVEPETNSVMECGYLAQLLANDGAAIWDKVLEKYHSLRKGGWSDENINALIDEYEADIYGSGAYARDKERWSGGNYMDAEIGLADFRAYVMQRLKETDLYYERLEELCRAEESFFVKQSAQYKDFLNSSFVIEINNRDAVLSDSDYSDFLTYLGVDLSAVTEDVQFIVADPVTGQYDYLTGMEEGVNKETSAGELVLMPVREGVYSVYLGGIFCYDMSAFSKPAIRTAFVQEGSSTEFDFSKGFDFHSLTGTMEELGTYLEALSSTNYYAVMEINNLALWQDDSCTGLFEKLGLTKEEIGMNTDLIVWNGLEKEAYALDNFHVNGTQYDTSIGLCSLFENEAGDYGVYLSDIECFVSSLEKNERKNIDIRILLFDSDSYEILEDIIFSN